MSQPFIGMIILVPYNFAPRGFAFCNGQICRSHRTRRFFAARHDLRRQRADHVRPAGSSWPGDGFRAVRGRVWNNNTPAKSPASRRDAQHQPDACSQDHVVSISQHERNRECPDAANGNTRNPANALPAVEAAGVTATYSDLQTGPVAAMSSQAISIAGSPTIANSGRQSAVQHRATAPYSQLLHRTRRHFPEPQLTWTLPSQLAGCPRVAHSSARRSSLCSSSRCRSVSASPRTRPVVVTKTTDSNDGNLRRGLFAA